MTAEHSLPVRESEFYCGDKALYVTVYDSGSSRWLVIAPPLFEELARTRKFCVNAARKIARAGFNVVRFDYYGTGLSEGKFEDFTLSQAACDLDTVIAMCRERGAAQVSCLGFRFGAYLAALRNSKDGVGRVIVWEPVFDLAAYITEVLKATAVDQIVTYGAIRFDQAALMDKLAREGRILVNGYALSLAAVEGFRNARPIERADVENTGVVLWRRSSLNKTPFLAELQPVVCTTVKVAWDHIKFLDHEPGELVESSLGLLKC